MTFLHQSEHQQCIHFYQTRRPATDHEVHANDGLGMLLNESINKWINQSIDIFNLPVSQGHSVLLHIFGRNNRWGSLAKSRGSTENAFVSSGLRDHFAWIFILKTFFVNWKTHKLNLSICWLQSFHERKILRLITKKNSSFSCFISCLS